MLIAFLYQLYHHAFVPPCTADCSGTAPGTGASHRGNEDGDLSDSDIWQAAVVSTCHGTAHAGPHSASSQRHRHQTLGRTQTDTARINIVKMQKWELKHLKTVFLYAFLEGSCMSFITLVSEQGFLEVVDWLDEVEPLLYCTPLISVLSRTHLLMNNIPAVSTKPWNTQQVSQMPSYILETRLFS